MELPPEFSAVFPAEAGIKDLAGNKDDPEGLSATGKRTMAGLLHFGPVIVQQDLVVPGHAPDQPGIRIAELRQQGFLDVSRLVHGLIMRRPTGFVQW